MYIYIHIPFCSHICTYCDFPKLLYNKKYISNYFKALEKEIKDRYTQEPVKTIFIGGGTPTSLDTKELEHLLKITNTFIKEPNIEFTIESNIESLTLEKIKLLKKYNVNRVSLGVQSFDKTTLKELNRHHTKEQTIKVISNLKQIGIKNISIDLIYGVHENRDCIKNDLTTFLSLDIPHISYYSLIIEQNTILNINKKQYINEEIEYEIYKYIEKTLKENNYIHYETSNYAKENYQSLHNLNYWNNGSYYGFGLGATSYINNYRITNTKNLTKYLNYNYQASTEYENEERSISNTIILGLRKINGLNIKEFEQRYNKNITDLYNIQQLIEDKKLILTKTNLYINPKYYYNSNDILINFL